MGLFRQHRHGNIQTTFLLKYSRVETSYCQWWRSEVKEYIVKHLLDIMLLCNDEISTITDIVTFRRMCRLDSTHITKGDIVRFKTLRIYRWLFNDFNEHLSAYLHQDEIVNLRNMIECSVLVATNSISLFEDFLQDSEMYNKYVRIILDSLMMQLEFGRFDIECLKKRFFAAVFIQQQWKETLMNPKYKICQNRLLREFHDLENETRDHKHKMCVKSRDVQC